MKMSVSRIFFCRVETHASALPRTRLRALRVAFGNVPSEAKLLRCMMRLPPRQTVRADFPHTAFHRVLFLLPWNLPFLGCFAYIIRFSPVNSVSAFLTLPSSRPPTRGGRGRTSARRSRTRLRALRVAFGEVPSERRSPFGGASPRSQPSYRHVVFFAVQIPLAHHSVSSAELCLAHHHHFPFFASFAFFAAKTHWNWSLALATLPHWQHLSP